MTGLRGTARLLRLALRRDRIKLPAWILALGVLMWIEIDALHSLYPTTKEQVAYAGTTASSAAVRMFGVIDGASLGSIAMVELHVSTCIVIALVSSMLVVRHTRQNEETGRLELVRSGEVGRHASLTAALLLAVATNVAFVLVCWLCLIVPGHLPAFGALLMAGSWGVCGLAFAGIAAITAQAAASARLANGLAGTLLAAAFAAQAAGAIAGELSADGMAVAIAWPSWLSPIGWGQLAYPFGEQRAWALGIGVLVFAASAALAFALSAHRDFGRGMLPERAANPGASRHLAGPLGLALRLHRTTIVAWGAGLLAMGAIGGGFASSVDDMLGENEQARAIFESAGGTDVLVDGYFAVMNSYIALLAAAFAVQVALRLRSEERGPGEALLATGTGRVRWMSSHLLIAAIAPALLLVASGVVMALLGQSTGIDVDVVELVGGSLAQVPAVLVYVGAAALGFGIASRWGGRLAWGLLGLSIVLLVASMLDLPQWVLDLSPISHAPQVPVEQVQAAPLVVLLAIAAAATVVGLLRFRARDLDTAA